jgi:hypothetical protein
MFDPDEVVAVRAAAGVSDPPTASQIEGRSSSVLAMQ